VEKRIEVGQWHQSFRKLGWQRWCTIILRYLTSSEQRTLKSLDRKQSTAIIAHDDPACSQTYTYLIFKFYTTHFFVETCPGLMFDIETQQSTTILYCLCIAHDPRVLPSLYANHDHLPTFMASPVETCPGSNLTQVQNGVTLPLTNPDIQGYAIRLSSECFRPIAVGLRLIFPSFYSTPMCRWGKHVSQCQKDSQASSSPDHMFHQDPTTFLLTPSFPSRSYHPRHLAL